jgi:cell shape-determining protein MreC
MAPVERFRNTLDASENARLRAALASTTALVADRDALYLENLQLKARLGRDADIDAILAGVIMRPPSTPYDTLMVDAGYAEGVAQGDLASAGGTTLIGRVSDVYKHSSRIVLFSAPGEGYDTLVQLSSQGGATVPLHMEGQGSGSLMGQLPANTQVAEGDSILFPGIASGFAGRVSKVTLTQGESFKTVYARLPVDPLMLQYVDVEKNTYAH